jgi:hypothetical protein
LAGRERQSEAEFERLRQQGFDFSQSRLVLRRLTAYQTAGLIDRIPALLEELKRLEPDNPLWPKLLEEAAAKH